jgi:PAS domain S-box-containing protein
MFRYNPLQWPKPPVIWGYGIAILSVTSALIIARWAALHFGTPPGTLFLCAVMLSAWFGGLGPGLLATILCTLAFHYYFVPPIHSLGPKSGEISRLFMVTMSNLFIVLLSAAQRSATESLRRTRDDLKVSVQELRSTNEALQAESRERKSAEESLLRSEGYLAEAQRLTHTGSWAWQIAGRKAVHLSDQWYRIYGLDPEDGLPTMEQLLQRTHPEDQARWREVIDRATEEKSNYDMEYRILLPAGTVKYIHVVGHPVLDASGNLLRFVGSSTDISERKRAEEALRRSEGYLAEAQRLSHTGSWARVAATDEIRYASEEFYRVLGFEAREGPPRFETFLQRVHPDDRAKVREMTEKARREKAEYEMDYRIIHPGGGIRDIHVIGHPVFNPSGDLFEYLGTVMDVTERKQAEESLRQAQADLARVNRMTAMGELTASLAHEVNQPIAAAVTNAKTCLRWLTRDDPDLEEARAAAMRIVNDGTRAAEIIKRIRLLFKKETSARELLDINEVIREMVVLLRGEAIQNSILVRTELDAEALRVMGDRVQLQQVLMNLMLNAMDAMKGVYGARELAIKSRRTETGQILISVVDTGVGLPLQQTDQLFNAFFTTKPNGTGMGLSISRSIVESHGGRLWAASNSPRGASFCFALPANAEAKE